MIRNNFVLNSAQIVLNAYNLLIYYITNSTNRCTSVNVVICMYLVIFWCWSPQISTNSKEKQREYCEFM